MARKIEDFIATLPHEEQAAIGQEAERLITQEMTLQELRKVRARSQRTVSEKLHVNQAEVSKIERRTDLYVSTLQNFVSALGGELELVARFPDGKVKISSFSDADHVGTVEE